MFNVSEFIPGSAGNRNYFINSDFLCTEDPQGKERPTNYENATACLPGINRVERRKVLRAQNKKREKGPSHSSRALHLHISSLIPLDTCHTW